MDMAWRELGILQFERSGAPSAPATWTEVPEPTWTWQDGLLDPDSIITPPVVIDAPSRVTAGKSFHVTVYTIGPDGCWSPDGHDIRISPGEVEILPYDRHSGAELCTRMIQYLPHGIVLTLDTPGTWTVRVLGRRASKMDVVRQTQVSARRTITVVQ